METPNLDFDAKTYLSICKGKGLCEAFYPVGSRVTCSPPPDDTDEDWLVYVDSSGAFAEESEREGFEVGDTYGADSEFDMDFASYRHGRVNLLVTESKKFVELFLAATSVAKKLNVMKKQHRKDLFEAVMYGRACSEDAIIPLGPIEPSTIESEVEAW